MDLLSDSLNVEMHCLIHLYMLYLRLHFLKNKQDFEEKLMEKESANVILAEQLKNIQLDLEQNDEELNENEKQHKIIVQDFESQIKTLKELMNQKLVWHNLKQK